MRAGPSWVTLAGVRVASMVSALEARQASSRGASAFVAMQEPPLRSRAELWSRRAALRRVILLTAGFPVAGLTALTATAAVRQAKTRPLRSVGHSSGMNHDIRGGERIRALGEIADSRQAKGGVLLQVRRQGSR